jgi:bifunctional UDP-N-acetylglucosamine pyrophosphorylase/glucosamine-1-phosphate N-acetyltransferase
MKAVILAAGQGTRIRPLSESTPKPMLPVGDRPLAAHTASAAVDAGAEELVFVVGYERETVTDYFGEEYAGVPVSYAHQEEQAGTADAVNAAGDRLDGPFAVLNGDNLYRPVDVERLFEAGPGVGATRAEHPENYGVFDTDGDSVTGIVEKPDDPPSNLVNVGAYAFPEEASEWLSVSKSERGEREITDVLAKVIAEYDVTPVEFDRWMDVGRPWELLEANEWVLDGLSRDVRGDVSEDAHLDGPVVVEEGATVKPGVVIEGPVLVRSGATIGPNAYVRGATTIGENAKVGHAVEIKNSVVRRDTNVGHLSYVGDSVLGRDVNFGAGTNVANLRHDGEDVTLTVKGDPVSTGRRKFGVVCGDGVKTGINTDINPGVKLSAGATTLAGETVYDDR